MERNRHLTLAYSRGVSMMARAVAAQTPPAKIRLSGKLKTKLQKQLFNFKKEKKKQIRNICEVSASRTELLEGWQFFLLLV